MKTSKLILIASAALATLFLSAAQAGPLAPPAGPVASTGKIQIPSLPFTITQPGSYILTSNLTGIAGQSGITINASNVTIDLNGFSLLGVPGSVDGIRPGNNHRNLTVINGVIADWGGNGVATFAPGVIGPLFIQTSRFDGLIVTGNGSIGISAGVSSVVINCIARDNVGTGIILTNSSGVAENCVAMNNGSDGIALADGGVVRGCSALSNAESGINVLNGQSTIVNCTADRNKKFGIKSSGRSIIRNCTATNNDLGGIQVNSQCYVVGNNSAVNGTFGLPAPGISIIGLENRIEDNNMTGNIGIGIQATGPGNLIIRNSARGNTIGNYSIIAGNSVGPIVNVAGVGDISATPNANHPWANFSY